MQSRWQDMRQILLIHRHTLQQLTAAARRFHNDEGGMSYIASCVFLVPLYIITISALVECAVMCYTKMGVTYAAYAAARSAIVWLPTDASPDEKKERILVAAAQALAPYASSDPMHLQPTGRQAYVGGQADRDYFDAYQHYCGGKAPFGLIARKRQYALGATEVSWKEVGPVPSDQELRLTRPLEVTVTYEKPISTPLMGLVFGGPASFPHAQFYSCKVTATVVLHQEGPKSNSGTLGIHYDPWKL